MEWKLINRIVTPTNIVNGNLIDETHVMDIKGSTTCLVKHTIRTEYGKQLSVTLIEKPNTRIIKDSNVENLYELVHTNFKEDNIFTQVPLPDPLFPVSENG